MIADIEFRTVDTEKPMEWRTFLRIFWDIPLSQNRYFTPRSDEFVDQWMESARETETERNTFSGVALHDGTIVGIHLIRTYEEYERLGAHIAGLWVHPDYRRRGIAGRLKELGEAWAHEVGAEFLNTNVQVGNEEMLRINEVRGFVPFRISMRKDLR
ncbi:MAG: GNAT family N-acetyltransferase [Candidatus Eisenbacteria bacterium]